MSALGHKQTFAMRNGMSALPPKADTCGAKRNRPLSALADIGSSIQSPGLLYRAALSKRIIYTTSD